MVVAVGTNKADGPSTQASRVIVVAVLVVAVLVGMIVFTVMVRVSVGMVLVVIVVVQMTGHALISEDVVRQWPVSSAPTTCSACDNASVASARTWGWSHE